MCSFVLSQPKVDVEIDKNPATATVATASGTPIIDAMSTPVMNKESMVV